VLDRDLRACGGGVYAIECARRYETKIEEFGLLCAWRGCWRMLW
jgi:hypothetical protein